MPTHAIISTHTTRHLTRTISGVASQSPNPASIVISCDSDSPEIAALVHNGTNTCSIPITLVQRPHQGASRSSQVRNNAVRALLAGPHHPSDILWFLDGDCCPAPGSLAVHERLGGPKRLVIGFRIDLSQDQTDSISDAELEQGLWPIQPTKQQLALLHTRHRRYVRAAWLRRLHLGKDHKPKLLSANFSVSLADYLAINGFDEEYTGYGQEDDDLGRRLYRTRVKPIIAVASAVVFHQYHPTRAPGDWNQSPNAARFAAPYQSRCTHGITNPAPQSEPIVTTFRPSRPPVRSDSNRHPPAKDPPE